jgi:pimeloyl-ACP methyl ester carboxylesterase
MQIVLDALDTEVGRQAPVGLQAQQLPIGSPQDDHAGAGPAVVFLHAGVADRTMWAELLEPLAEARFRAIAMDLPGFGEAPPAVLEDAPWLDVLETMDALGRLARNTGRPRSV